MGTLSRKPMSSGSDRHSTALIAYRSAEMSKRHLPYLFMHRRLPRRPSVVAPGATKGVALRAGRYLDTVSLSRHTGASAESIGSIRQCSAKERAKTV